MTSLISILFLGSFSKHLLTKSFASLEIIFHLFSIKGAGSLIVCLAISFSLSSGLSKGNRPTNNKYDKIPIVHISTLLLYSFPLKTSGATYDTVPKG